MKKFLKIVLIVLVILIIIGAAMYTYLMTGQKEIRNMTISNINLTNVKDGTYEGAYDQNNRFDAAVEVTVSNHQITDIKVTKIQSVEIPDLKEKLVSDVIQKQSLDIDAISGATISTKAYLKAIENALEKGL